MCLFEDVAYSCVPIRRHSKFFRHMHFPKVSHAILDVNACVLYVLHIWETVHTFSMLFVKAKAHPTCVRKSSIAHADIDIFVTGKFESLRMFDQICMQIYLQICMHISKPTSYLYLWNLYHILKRFIIMKINICMTELRLPDACRTGLYVRPILV